MTPYAAEFAKVAVAHLLAVASMPIIAPGRFGRYAATRSPGFTSCARNACARRDTSP